MFREIYEPERGQRVPVRVWARSLDHGSVRQLQHIASQPYVALHVAAMADAHVAYGVAVGTVFATEYEIIPGALGGDLGCGMSAVRTNVAADRLDHKTRERIVATLGRAIPAGKHVHRGVGTHVPDELFDDALSTSALEHTRVALVRRQLGTLGGGNDFIELDRDPEGNVWALVHSGSRGLGGAIAEHHARVVGDQDVLGALATRALACAAYVADLGWALAFARENRRRLLLSTLETIAEELSVSLEYDEDIDVHHNYVAEETWFGRSLFVHRKGAVAASSGSLALVPGSMGTATYLVRGRGNEASFGSCSHGAGRIMTRAEARARIRPHKLARSMGDVVYPKHLERSLVEEAPAAYRDIGEVIEDQADLVDRHLRLLPLAVLKG